MNKEELMQLASTLGGLCILGCLPDSPAALAGLRYGDVVLEVNGVRTGDWGAFVRAVHGPSHDMQVRFFRGGVEHEVVLSLPAARRAQNPAALVADVAQRVLSVADTGADAEAAAAPPEWVH